MKFRSRISVLLALIILSIYLRPLMESLDHIAKIISISIPLLLTVLIVATINYTISDGYLIVRTFGFKMATINIAKIKTIKRSYIPLSSPAASLRRLEVKFYHKGRVETALISPVHEAKFLEMLKDINPRIEIKVIQRRNILRLLDYII